MSAGFFSGVCGSCEGGPATYRVTTTIVGFLACVECVAYVVGDRSPSDPALLWADAGEVMSIERLS